MNAAMLLVFLKITIPSLEESCEGFTKLVCSVCDWDRNALDSNISRTNHSLWTKRGRSSTAVAFNREPRKNGNACRWP